MARPRIPRPRRLVLAALALVPVLVVLPALAVDAGAALAVASGTRAVARSAAPGPWVVSVGDSYIGGEGGRWAGNTRGSSVAVDALGPRAYDSPGPVPVIPGCHRAKSAPIHIGDVRSANLACSGARASTVRGAGGRITPGLDFFSDRRGTKGQARLLQEFATGRRVRLVVVSIGGNDLGFGTVVRTCVRRYLSSPAWWPRLCRYDPLVTATVTSANVAWRTARIRTALRNVRRAMADAGHADTDYTILVETYPSVLPRAERLRYPALGGRRQTVGGCGLWNADADWANDTFLRTVNQAVRTAAASSGLANLRVLDLTQAFRGRRLCERGVGLLEERGLRTWKAPGAVDKTEWVSQIRLQVPPGSGYSIQESLHPSYWGQLAIRNCLRQAYRGGAPRGGVCARSGKGLTSRGEPVMRLR